LDVLRKQGLLIDLNITGTGMFSKAATWEDLGIADIPEEKRTSQFTKGQKSLIPDGMVKKLKSVKARMSQLLERRSYKVAGFHPYRWISFTAYASFKEEWEELLAEFEQVKAEIIQDDDKYVDQMANASRSWRSQFSRSILSPKPMGLRASHTFSFCLSSSESSIGLQLSPGTAINQLP
jgi:hypothetical protein